MKQLHPDQAALQLLRSGLKVSEYENGVQAERKKRLEFFKEVGIPFLVEQEQELISYGEKVINAMKLYNLLRFCKENS